MDSIKLFNGDCLEIMKTIPTASVDMVLCDLPYAVTDFSWDVIIPCDKLFAEYRRILKQNANIVLFCQQPFTTTLINGVFKTEFSHSLIWKKNNKTRAKSSKTVPLSSYEEAVVFRVNKVGNKSRHKRLREYFTGELAKCGYSVKELEEMIPNRSAHHWFRFSSDFRIPTERNYKRLQEITGRFSEPYEIIRKEFDEERKNFCTYNPQGENCNVLFYNVPTPKERKHPTQKPVDLLEHLILSYSNEGETVIDNCMGSGSCGVACVNTGRKFIGIELDKDYFNIAKERIEKSIRERD
jgi:DNA modification methylase